MPEKYFVFNEQNEWIEIEANAFWLGLFGKKVLCYPDPYEGNWGVGFGLLDDRDINYRTYGRIVFKNETT